MPLFNILCFYTLTNPSGLIGSRQKTNHRKKQVEKKPAIDLRRSSYYTNPLLKVQKMVCASDNAQHRLPAIEDSMTEWLPKPTPADILISYRSHPIAVSCCNRFFASIMMNLVCGCKGR